MLSYIRVMRFLVLLVTLLPSLLFAQIEIDHWETIVAAESQWKYLVPTSQPNISWKSNGFNDNSWLSANGGIGYGDGDDNFIIPNTSSLYLRKEFNAINIDSIKALVFNMDFDDGFVAYLNGVEIARENLGAPNSVVFYNQYTTAQHEAQLYQGGKPNSYIIPLASVNLQSGTNVLAVEVHNATQNSSDLTALPYLHVGLSNSGLSYSNAQTWFEPPFTSSNLPIVKIYTNSQTILDTFRIIADMEIINNASGLNYYNDLPSEYNGKISIELRGSSSQTFPKKSYSLETQDTLGNNNNVPLLGMPKENDWVLNAPYSDKSHLRNVLTFELGRRIDRYTPRTSYCEVFVNDEYKGLYVLMEKIKIDKNRVDIATLNPDDTIGDQLTGGYIVKIDRLNNPSDGGWVSPYPNLAGNDLDIVFHRPKNLDLNTIQKNYIEDYITDFENALSGNNFQDPLLGYEAFIDVGSFIDLYLINELSKDIDAYRLSTFFYKDKDSKGGKIVMGPLWDYNLTYGNVDYCNGHTTTGWNTDEFCALGSPFWFERLLEDENYRNKMKCRWTSIRENEWSTPNINLFIDSIANYIDEAQVRNFNQWPTLGTYVWPNYYIGNTYDEEVQNLKSWITARLNWMDINILGNCITGCTDALACNFSSDALLDDGSCIFPTTYYDCFGNCINDADGDLICNELDNCPNLSNASQIDLNMNGVGDACDIANALTNFENNNKSKILYICDLLGREVSITSKGIIIIQFEDGHFEKRFNE